MAEELKENDFTTYDYPAGYQYYNFLNLERPHLENLEFRKALNFLLNREDFIQGFHGGEIPTGLFSNIFSFNGENKVEYNPQKGLDLLEKLDYKKKNEQLLDAKGNPVVLKILTYSTRPDLPLIAQMIVSDLEKMGIQTTVELTDSIDEEARKKDFDLLLYAQNETASGDPHYFFAQHFKTGARKNTMSYSNPKVDFLVDELGVTSSLEEQENLQEFLSREIGYITQDVQNSLNLYLPILKQLTTDLEFVHDIEKEEARKMAENSLEKLGIPAYQQEKYPDEFSGGIKQKVVLSMILNRKPELLIADEISSSLDNKSRKKAYKFLLEKLKMSPLTLILISHNPQELISLTDRIYFLEDGEITEEKKSSEIFETKNLRLLELLEAGRVLYGKDFNS